MLTYNALQDYEEGKDFEGFLITKDLIIQEFQDGLQQTLLKTLESVYRTGYNLTKTGELMHVLLQGREMLKTG